MTEDLKSAIRTIAEYDGWVYTEENRDYLEKRDGKSYDYTTSADALLPVWRKVSEQVDDELNKGGEIIKWKVRTDMLRGSILLDIGFNLLETACLKLAQIISQLNEQK